MRKLECHGVRDGGNGCPGQTIMGVVHERVWLHIEGIRTREWRMDGFAVWEHEWYLELLPWATAWLSSAPAG